MVVVIAIDARHMQRDICRLREAVQPVCDHLCAQSADALPLEPQVNHRPRAAGQINDRPREGFVKGGVAAAETGDARAGS